MSVLTQEVHVIGLLGPPLEPVYIVCEVTPTLFSHPPTSPRRNTHFIFSLFSHRRNTLHRFFFLLLSLSIASFLLTFFLSLSLSCTPLSLLLSLYLTLPLSPFSLSPSLPLTLILKLSFPSKANIYNETIITSGTIL